MSHSQIRRLVVAVSVLGSATIHAERSFKVSDPCIWRDDAAKVYRLYHLSSIDEPCGAGVMMRTSTNLVDWSAPEQVLRVPDEYRCTAVWAPEMHAYNGAYYLFGTIATKMAPSNTVAAIPGWTGYGEKLRKRLSTYIFKAERPEGPYRVWSDGPITPRTWAALDGTLFVEDGKPYMVFCHEWTQLRDGTMDAVELTPDLTRPAGEPFTLFKASAFYGEEVSTHAPNRSYVTDGPWFYRSKTGDLFMLWSTHDKGYVQVASRSVSGKLRGPWTDHSVLYRLDSGHGMIFETFEGKKAIAFHSLNNPHTEKRLRIHELIDEGKKLRIGRQIGGDFTPRPASLRAPAVPVHVTVKTRGTPTVTHPPRYGIVAKRKVVSLFCRATKAEGRLLLECTNLAVVPQPLRIELDDGQRRSVSVPAGETVTYAFPVSDEGAPRAASAERACGHLIVTDEVKADGRTDASAGLQRLIEANPNRTLFFPDGVYLLTRPIATPADPGRSVDLRLSNYAILRAAPNWTNTEAMVRLGGIHPANNIRLPGSNYSLTGGVIDGAGRAKGVSIESGRETKVTDVSLKNVLVGLHIKPGANNNSSDADVSGLNIVGNGAADSVGVLVEGHDNTFSNIRIAHVKVGVRLRSSSNFLRDIHPLFTGPWKHYADSVGFDDNGSNNYYNGCYSDQFATGFLLGKRESTTVLDNCQVFWYRSVQDGPHTGIRTEGRFNALCTGLRVAFQPPAKGAVNTVLAVGKDGGKGVLRDLRVPEDRINEKAQQYLSYQEGVCH